MAVKKKKGNNEGSIRKRPNGKWEARYSAGLSSDGKQVQRSIYGNTRAEVAKKLNEVLISNNPKEYVTNNRLTLSQWLETWLKNYASVALRSSTYISYEGYIYNHINPIIGSISLKDLTTEKLQLFYNERFKSGRVDGAGGLSPKTLRNLHNMLHKALDQACKNNLISINVSEGTVLPKQIKKEMRVLSKNEQQTLLKYIDNERLGFAILLDLSTGMRIGELCALKWNDIDFENKVIYIRRTLQRVKSNLVELDSGNFTKTRINEGSVKTDNSYREVPIQTKIFEKLLLYKQQQTSEKEYAGSAYTDCNYVFATQIGSVMNQPI